MRRCCGSTVRDTRCHARRYACARQHLNGVVLALGKVLVGGEDTGSSSFEQSDRSEVNAEKHGWEDTPGRAVEGREDREHICLWILHFQEPASRYFKAQEVDAQRMLKSFRSRCGGVWRRICISSSLTSIDDILRPWTFRRIGYKDHKARRLPPATLDNARLKESLAQA